MTWALIEQSFAVLKRDKKLIVFPVLSAAAAIAVTVPFFTALAGGAAWHMADVWRMADVHWTGGIRWLWLFLWYCLMSFVIIFFNCALAVCAQTRFSGGEPVITEGLRQAWNRAGRIFLWAVVTSTVGSVIRAVQDRVGFLGRIVAAAFGLGWTLATYLMVPVLVLEDRGVMESIRRSSEMLKKTWGEQVVVGLHFMWLTVVLAIPGIILGITAWPLGILYFLALAATLTAARGIFVVALYRYAVTGEAPDGFSREALDGAFRRR